jgi:hypothetical protein
MFDRRVVFAFSLSCFRNRRVPHSDLARRSDQPATMAEDNQDKGGSMTVPKAKVRRET